MKSSLRIHLCGSNRDLASERHALLAWLEDCRLRTPHFSYFGARTLPSLESALQDIAASDVIILVVGHLYGIVSPGQNRAQEEREYEEATRLGKTILVYLRDEESGRVPGSVERDAVKIPLLQNFRRRLSEQHKAKTFRDQTQLTQILESDILSILSERGLQRKQIDKPLLRTRATTPETDKGNQGDGSLGGSSNDSGTRTLPLLQKALSTPFSPSGPPRNKNWRGTALLAILIAPLLALGLWKGNWLQHLSSPKTNLAPLSPIAIDSTAKDTLSELGDTLALSDSMSVNAAPPPVESRPDPLATLLTKAKEGDTTALLQVGTMYDSGLTLPQDDSLATSHYRRAASNGMAEAQYRLALRHLAGKGAKRSKAQAMFWLQSAATKGHAVAQSHMGRIYFKGQGYPRDEALGLKWLLKAADQKDPEAERILAEIKGQP